MNTNPNNLKCVGLLLLLLFVQQVSAYYDPGVQRWINRDPMGEQDSPNMFQFCRNYSIGAVDAFGYDTYRCNRKLGGGPALPQRNPLSHTFVFTTNPDGTVSETYSWGNSANSRGWSRNQPEDIGAAQEALQRGEPFAHKMGDSNLDPLIERAFQQLDREENEHINLGIIWNCKWESDDLISLAKKQRKIPTTPIVFYGGPQSGGAHVNSPPSTIVFR